MKNVAAALMIAVTLAAQQATAALPVVVVNDADGAAGRVAAPVSLRVDLAAMLGDRAKGGSLELTEIGEGGKASPPVHAQFVPEADGATRGALWWLMPPGPKGQRRFRLTVAAEPVAAEVVANRDKAREAVDVAEGKSPVLRYNHGTVPPPPRIVDRYEKQQKPPLYYARGDYIHPVFGPDGEELTDDYSLDHPHHRGICWAWPVVRYKGEVRDIWAVCVLPNQPGGVWARPVALHQVASGPVLAVIDAENVWKWSDETPIVREDVVIRAFRQTDRRRFLDVEIRLAALVDGVSIGGRPHASYGGFNMRTYPEFDQRKIDMRIDPPGAEPRRAWFHLTGNFPGGKGPAGVAMLEHVGNPDYPSSPNPQDADRVHGKYPRWRSVQPAWPGDREVALPKGETLVLRYRLWIHPGLSDDATLADVWASYAKPAAASVTN
jgi:hypothetical protein